MRRGWKLVKKDGKIYANNLVENKEQMIKASRARENFLLNNNNNVVS